MVIHAGKLSPLKGALNSSYLLRESHDVGCLKLTSKVCAGGGYKNVLVVGADALSRYVDWTDRGTCILFGDASGALLLQVCCYLSSRKNLMLLLK